MWCSEPSELSTTATGVSELNQSEHGGKNAINVMSKMSAYDHFNMHRGVQNFKNVEATQLDS